MKKIAIIGVGLMGGSLGLALKRLNNKNKKLYEVLGIGRNEKNLRKAKKLGAIDSYSLDMSSVSDADVVFICSPVDTIFDIYKTISKIVKKGAIITDVGSIKECVDKEIQSFRKKNKNLPEFVACHPMAGIEYNGVHHAKDYLYDGATTIITADKKSKGAKIVAKIWKDAGCEIVYMSSTDHDKYVGFTSHLPHIVAFVYYKIFKEKCAKDKNINNLVAGSFHSITRVAKSSPKIWSPIFLNNKKNLKVLSQQLCDEIKKLVATFDDEKKLTKFFN